jgi:hypothetical protein
MLARHGDRTFEGVAIERGKLGRQRRQFHFWLGA